MKNTGINRKIDDLGRIVIPIELREELGIKKQDQFEISIENGKLVLEIKSDQCIFCGSQNHLSKMKTKNVCSTCITEMNGI